MSALSTPPATAASMPPSGRTLRRWMRAEGWRHLLGVVAIVYALFPIVFVLSASVNERGSLTGSNRLFTSFSLSNMTALFTTPTLPYAQWYSNTMVVALWTATGSLVLCATAAFAFSRLRFRGRRSGLGGLMILQMFPQLLAYVAIFLLAVLLGEVFPAIGLNTHLGLVMIYLGGALGTNTYLMYGFFNTIPREIDEAATIDGASHLRIFGMVLWLSVPILAVVWLLSFIAAVNEFVIASVILTNVEQQTLAVGLQGLVSGQFAKNWGVFAAGAVLAGLPIVVLFQLLQRYIVAGIASGAVKG